MFVNNGVAEIGFFLLGRNLCVKNDDLKVKPRRPTASG